MFISLKAASISEYQRNQCELSPHSITPSLSRPFANSPFRFLAKTLFRPAIIANQREPMRDYFTQIPHIFADSEFLKFFVFLFLV